jgi:MFS family permease
MRPTRLVVTFFFLADGLLIGSWAARIPAVQRVAGLTNSELGIALFAMSLGALVSMPLAGWLAERIGSRRVTVAALLGGAVSLFVASLAASLLGVAAALLGFGAAFGAMNVAANAQGLALERRYGRSILSSFHAAFSTGGLIGAGLGALAAAAGIEPPTHFGALGVVLGVGAVVGGHRLVPPTGDPPPASILVRPPRRLFVLGMAAFFTLLAEGAAADWSAVYLKGSLSATAAVAALGYTAFSLAMAASRALGDRIGARVGAAALASSGGLLAATGLALALGVGSIPAALAGFAAMGAGLGVVVPVLFRAAGSTAGVPVGVGLAAVSTIGWLGFLAGPPAIGFVAGVVGLRSALLIVVAAILTAALLSRSAGRKRRQKVHALVFEPAAIRSNGDRVLVESGQAIERTC